MSDKIPIGISACLLGEAVRFDGGHKRLAFAVEQLAPYVRFEPVCPEMAIGLPTPRPLRLVKQAQPWPAMRYSNDAGVDLTEEMRGFCAARGGLAASVRLYRLRQVTELRLGAGAGLQRKRQGLA